MQNEITQGHFFSNYHNWQSFASFDPSSFLDFQDDDEDDDDYYQLPNCINGNIMDEESLYQIPNINPLLSIIPPWMQSQPLPASVPFQSSSIAQYLSNKDAHNNNNTVIPWQMWVAAVDDLFALANKAGRHILTHIAFRKILSGSFIKHFSNLTHQQPQPQGHTERQTDRQATHNTHNKRPPDRVRTRIVQSTHQHGHINSCWHFPPKLLYSILSPQPRAVFPRMESPIESE